jgi:nitroreductase
MTPKISSIAVELPTPSKDGGLNIGRALALRRTTRAFAEKDLPQQVLSDLLWAASGVNREAGPFGAPGITAASASNSQEIDLYVALAEGAYVYHARRHRLERVADSDLRAATMTPGQRGIDARAPVGLIYVADVAKLARTQGFEEPGLHDPETQKAYYFVDAGLIAGNVYLFAAAHGLAAWFHNCDKSKLQAALNLRPEQRPLFAQSVGYPPT